MGVLKIFFFNKERIQKKKSTIVAMLRGELEELPPYEYLLC